MTTLRKWFEEFTAQTGETPEAVVFGWSEYREYHAEQWPTLPQGVAAWGDVDPAILEREFDDGYGGNESPNLCAWSPSWVLFSDDYDGCEGLQWVPRNPTAHDPDPTRRRLTNQIECWHRDARRASRETHRSGPVSTREARYSPGGAKRFEGFGRADPAPGGPPMRLSQRAPKPHPRGAI